MDNKEMDFELKAAEKAIEDLLASGVPRVHLNSIYGDLHQAYIAAMVNAGKDPNGDVDITILNALKVIITCDSGTVAEALARSLEKASVEQVKRAIQLLGRRGVPLHEIAGAKQFTQIAYALNWVQRYANTNAGVQHAVSVIHSASYDVFDAAMNAYVAGE